MSEDRKLELSLALMRLSTGVFFLVWAVKKLVSVDSSQRIFKKFYFIDAMPAEALIAIGIIQVIIVFAFMAGVCKKYTTGFLLVIHALSVASSYQQLADPYFKINDLFWAGVPVLFMLLALYLLRDRDKLWTFSGFDAENEPGGS